MIQRYVAQGYGGDTTKRWYIDTYTDGDRQRTYIDKYPLATYQARFDAFVAECELQMLDQTQQISKTLLEVIENKQLRHKSIATYRSEVKVFINYLRSKNVVTWKGLTSSIIDSYIVYLKSTYHPNTVINKVQKISTICKFANRNPFKNKKLNIKEIDSGFHEAYNPYMQKLIKEYLLKHDIRLYLFVQFIFYSYIRPTSELLNIRISDIDIEGRVIRVSGKISKNGKSETCPIIKPLYDLILEHQLLENPGHYYLFGYELVSSLKKCPGNYPSTLYMKYLKELGVYDSRVTTLYAWKHTGNIAAAMGGMDMLSLQRRNRHKSIETTEIYLRKLGLLLDPKIIDFEY